MNDDDAWEDISSPHTGDYLERIVVPGGWIYRQIFKTDMDKGLDVICCALTFVPRPGWMP